MTREKRENFGWPKSQQIEVVGFGRWVDSLGAGILARLVRIRSECAQRGSGCISIENAAD